MGNSLGVIKLVVNMFGVNRFEVKILIKDCRIVLFLYKSFYCEF